MESKNKILSSKFNPGRWEISTLKIIKHWWKKLKKTHINGKVAHAHGLEKLVLLKCPYDPKQPTDSLQSL